MTTPNVYLAAVPGHALPATVRVHRTPGTKSHVVHYERYELTPDDARELGYRLAKALSQAAADAETLNAELEGRRLGA